MMTDSEKIQSLEYELDITRARLTDLRLSALETSRADHEQRLRNVEEVATKFNFLMALSIGGGALSAIVLIRAALGY
jgi:hypothetical protein